MTYSCRWLLLSGEGNSPWCVLGSFAHQLYVIADEHLPACFSFKSTLFFKVKNFKGNFKSNVTSGKLVSSTTKRTYKRTPLASQIRELNVSWKLKLDQTQHVKPVAVSL